MRNRKKTIPKSRGRVAQPSYMPKDELGSLLEQMGLNLTSGAKFLRLDRKTLWRLRTGWSPIDARTAMLLRAMAHYNISPQEVSRLLDE